MSQVFIVAEIGCNHNGNPELAKKMIDVAKECGVDAVKFQTFKADKLISKYAPKAEYQKVTTGTADSQLEMTRKLELSYDEFRKLEAYARSLELEVFSTPFDMESIDFLASEKQKVWKIPSGELTNLPYLEKIASLPIEGKSVVISTGMATIEEIKDALSILEKNGIKKEEITILHCNTEYPTPYEDVNLNAFYQLKTLFSDYNLGFSDHSVGYFAGLAAVPYGITFIEKHFRTINDKQHRAIAGLSMGGLHTIAISANNPGLFDYIGLFSPQSVNILTDNNIKRIDKITSGIDKFMDKMPSLFQKVYDGKRLMLTDVDMYKDIDNKLINQFSNPPVLYYIAIGKEDPLKPFVDVYRTKLSNIGCVYTYNETSGGHSWENWRKYLLDFLPHLFK